MRIAELLFHAARPAAIFAALFIVLVGGGPRGNAIAGEASLTQQRDRFLQAEKALKTGDKASYRRLKAGLADYPLYPYLIYAEHRRRLANLTPAKLIRFEEDYQDTPLPALLRRQWLNLKAARQQWYDFLKGYQKDNSISRQCHYLNALIHTGRRVIAHRQVPELWLSGRNRPKACDPVFNDWIAHGKLTPGLLRQRTRLAMAAGSTKLVRHLAKRMSARDKRFARTWLKMMAKPSLLLDGKQHLPRHKLRDLAYAPILAKLIREDSAGVLKQWPALTKRLALPAATRQQLARKLGFRLLSDKHPQALEFLDRLDLPSDDIKLHERRLRAAIATRDWPRLLRWLRALPEQARETERWRYWRARALEAVGIEAEAKKLYAKVARERSYYGFLAADRIGADYNLLNNPVAVSEASLADIEDAPALARMRELYALNRATDARREWREFTADMPVARLQAAAKLAQHQGWLDRAIFTLARTGYWDDLELRFPLRHRDTIRDQAERNDLDDAWVFAVVRQESAFMHDARSRTGATGLMQLMPATARLIARELKRKKPRRADLLKAETNIALGTGYLNKVKRQLGDSIVLATAAYNAGPHRVKRWLPEIATDADIWVESIPFHETRGYVRRVMSYLILYEMRLGRTHSAISERMGVIAPALDAKVKVVSQG